MERPEGRRTEEWLKDGAWNKVLPHRHTHCKEWESDTGKAVLVWALSVNLLGFILPFPLSLRLASISAFSNANEITLFSLSFTSSLVFNFSGSALHGNDNTHLSGNTVECQQKGPEKSIYKPVDWLKRYWFISQYSVLEAHYNHLRSF